MLFIVILFLYISSVCCQDFATPLLIQDICPGRSATLKCSNSQTTNYTVYVNEALYGVKSSVSETCEYTEGDCYGVYTSSYCASPFDSCTITASSTYKISNCDNEVAEYLHLRYRCAPMFSSSVKENNVCGSGDITELSGFVSSPNYPTYTVQTTECTRKIVVPSNRVINLWIAYDMKSADSSNNCPEDYVKVTDNTGTYIGCGYRKGSFESRLCSSTIYISYKAPAQLSSVYRGFRLYYETVDRSTQPDCPTNTPQPPTPPVITTTQPPLVRDLVATKLTKRTVCRGTDFTIDIPRDFNLFPINYYYGITTDFTCNTIGPQNCKAPAPYSCTSTGSCKISLSTSVTVKDCGDKTANYIGIDYRFVPFITTRNFTICENLYINGTTTPYGIITSTNYPTWETNKNCLSQIIAPEGKIVRAFVNDLNIERDDGNGNCQNGYLSLSSECGGIKYCGEKVASYVYESCSNLLQISYVSTTATNFGFRGFNIYFEVTVPESSSSLLKRDLCPGSSATIKCDQSFGTNFTVFSTEAIYGVKSVNSVAPNCTYSEGDCYDVSSTSYCASPTDSCTFSSSSTITVANCQNKKSDYFHVRHRCIPVASNSINQYNICDKTLQDIKDPYGLIGSPNYPTYTQVSEDCTQRIVAPANKVIRMWIAADMKSTDTVNVNCATDYVKVTDNTGTYVVCGYRKLALETQLCSSTIYVSYKAPANLGSIYRGAQIYYEFVDRSTQPDCPTNTPASPTTPATTTTTRQVIFDLKATSASRLFVCRGNTTTLTIPTSYNLFVNNFYYGVSNGGTCSYSSSDCKAPATLLCPTQGTCQISFLSNVAIADCGSKPANYVALEYRFIPYISTKNFSICDNVEINANLSTYGIITSPNYPSFTPNLSCQRNIVAPVGSKIVVYLNDYSIELPDNNNNCQNGYLLFTTSCSSFKYCGEKSIEATNFFETCSNTLTIQYVSTSTTGSFRGFNIYYEVNIKDAASELYRKDYCAGTAETVRCQSSVYTNFTLFVIEALYGSSLQTTNKCYYNPGECYEVASSLTTCPTLADNCYLSSSSSITLANCQNKKADYLHVRYRCIPARSVKINQYDICDKNIIDIRDTNGLISSPGHPRYQPVTEECTQKLVAPNNKIFKIWIGVDIKSQDANKECPFDYVKITDTTGTYKTCGYRKVSFENVLCSSVIYVSYSAPSNLSATLYYGFQLYYEMVDRSTQPGCPTGTAGVPTTQVTTTTAPPLIADLAASNVQRRYVCAGNKTTIDIPKNYLLYPLDIYYGATKDQTCNSINPQNCRSPASISCSLQGSCEIPFLTNVILDDCNNQSANYIGIDYRFIPLTSTKNFSICENTNIDANLTRYGVITSPNYPIWGPNRNCLRNIIAPANKVIRLYVSDLDIENPDSNGDCQTGYLSLKSDCETIKICGTKEPNSPYIIESCTSSLTIQYVSTTSTTLLRGFNLYYELTNPEKASNRFVADVCAGSSSTLRCENTPTTNFTIVVSEAINGVKKLKNNTCELKDGDCSTGSTSTYCSSTLETCSVSSSSFTLVPKCNDSYADYLHLRYRCIPISSNTIREYNICDKSLSDIKDSNGLISSPNYPKFSAVNDECSVKIVAPRDKIINVWMPDVNMKISEPNNNCLTDYLKITHNTGNNKVCGARKYSYENKLCSSEMIVSYKAPTSSSGYKGFKLYYEFIDRSTQPNCPTDIPTDAPTTPIITSKPELTDLQALELKNEFICKGKDLTIQVPPQYVFFPIELYYGVTADGTCDSIDQSDCKASLSNPCTAKSKCHISLYNEVEVEDCNSQIASYIGVKYRFIPFYSLKNVSICDNSTINLSKSVNKYGVITSPNYPVSLNNVECKTKLIAPNGKVLRVYLTDLNTEFADEDDDKSCKMSFISLTSNNIETKYCGDKIESGDYVYESCSNSLEILYIAPKNSESSYRGFNLYFETVEEKNSNCPTTPEGIKEKENHNGVKYGLGIGIPLTLIAAGFGIFFILKRRKNNHGVEIKFSRFKNDEVTSFRNKNY